MNCVLLLDGDLHCVALREAAGLPVRGSVVDRADNYMLAVSRSPVATDVAHASIDAGGVSWIDSSGQWWRRRCRSRGCTPVNELVTFGRARVPFVAIVSSLDETCARSSGGEVWCVGREQSDARLLLGDSLEIAAGARHFCARLRGDVVQCWGDPAFGRLGRQTSNGWSAERVSLEEPVLAASAGWGHSCAILRSGRVLCWGLRDVETTEDAEAGLSVGARYRTVFVPTEIRAARASVAIATRGTTTCVIREGDRACWRGSDGVDLRRVTEQEFAVNTATEFHREEGLDDAIGVVEGCTGAGYHCLLVRDGVVRCSVPDCAREAHSTPTCIPGGAVAIAGLPGPMTGLSCGGAHACAWNANGELFCWGSDVFAQRATRVDRDSSTPRAVDVRFDEPPREE
jgi:hypothetical protein